MLLTASSSTLAARSALLLWRSSSRLQPVAHLPVAVALAVALALPPPPPPVGKTKATGGGGLEAATTVAADTDSTYILSVLH